MFGHLFVGFEKFVIAEYGAAVWDDLLKESRVSSGHYKIMLNYPDEEAAALVSQLSRVTGKTVSDTWEQFGTFMAFFFVDMYKVFFKSNWTVIDFLENIEESIHSELRLYNPGLTPPEIESTRLSDNEVEIVYKSPRKMCAFAAGLIKGFGAFYHENVTIIEKSCMLEGSPVCRLSIITDRTPLPKDNNTGIL